MNDINNESEWDDDRVIAAVKRGDLDRFAVLVNRYQTKAIHLAYSLLGNHADATEAAQDAFVSAYSALSRYRKTATFSTWFYAIVYNKCRDRLRKRNHVPLMMVLDEQMGDQVDAQAADPSGSIQDRELAAAIASAVATLSDKQQEAFRLYHMQGRTLKETAQLMNCRLGTVKAHVFRATRQLQKILRSGLKEVTNEA